MKRLYYILLLAVTLTTIDVTRASAQVIPNNFTTIEALVLYHQWLYPKLKSRLQAETARTAIHAGTEDAVEDYRDMTDELETYYKCHNLLSTIVAGASTFYNVKTTLASIETTIKNYTSLVAKYNSYIVEYGLSSSDIKLFTTTSKLMDIVYDDGASIADICTTAIAYTTGTANCKVSDVQKLLNDFNAAIDKLDEDLNRIYNLTYKYVYGKMRQYQKAYTKADKSTITQKALSRWNANGEDKSTVTASSSNF